jgi:hypothetical protein
MALSLGALAILCAWIWVLWDYKANGPGWLMGAGAALLVVGKVFGI